MNKQTRVVLVVLVCTIMGGSASQADMVFDLTEFHGGSLYPSNPGPLTEMMWGHYVATPDFPQLAPALADGVYVFLHGLVDNIVSLPPDPESFYVWLGVPDPRYGQSTYSGTWQLFTYDTGDLALETGTFALTMTYRPEFVTLDAPDLLTSMTGTFLADPGSVLVPIYGPVDWWSARPMAFSGYSDLWGGIMGTILAQSPLQPVIPEPTTLFPIGIGLVVLAARRRLAAHRSEETP